MNEDTRYFYNDPSYHRLKAFVQARIDEAKSLPTLTLAARQILYKAALQEDTTDRGYPCGYADGTYDCLCAISGVWKYHPDYEGWADDDDDY